MMTCIFVMVCYFGLGLWIAHCEHTFVDKSSRYTTPACLIGWPIILLKRMLY